jgi:amidase
MILCPVGPRVAPLHDTARYWGYTAVWNALDWSACSIPTGMKVSVDDHPMDTKHIPEPNEFEPDNWEKYSPESYKDNELVLKVVAKIEEIIAKDKQ